MGVKYVKEWFLYHQILAKNKDLMKIPLAVNNQQGPIKICIRDLSQIRSLGITEIHVREKQ